MPVVINFAMAGASGVGSVLGGIVSHIRNIGSQAATMGRSMAGATGQLRGMGDAKGGLESLEKSVQALGNSWKQYFLGNVVSRETFALLDQLKQFIVSFAAPVFELSSQLMSLLDMRSILETGKQFDTFRAQFKAAFKDTSVAGKEMQNVLRIAAETPFEATQLVDAATKFQAVGLNVTSSVYKGREIIKDIGDLAFAAGRSLDEAVFSIKQASSEGRWRSLTESFGITKQQVMGTLRAVGEQVDFSTPQKSLESLSNFIRVRYGGSMEEMSDKIVTMKSNIGDLIASMKDKLYTSGIEDVIKDIYKRIFSFLEGFSKGDASPFTKLVEIIGTAVRGAYGFVQQAAPVILDWAVKIGRQVSSFLTSAFNDLVKLKPAVLAVGIGLEYAVGIAKDLGTAFNTAWGFVKKIGDAIDKINGSAHVGKQAFGQGLMTSIPGLGGMVGLGMAIAPGLEYQRQQEKEKGGVVSTIDKGLEATLAQIEKMENEGQKATEVIVTLLSRASEKLKEMAGLKSAGVNADKMAAENQAERAMLAEKMISAVQTGTEALQAQISTVEQLRNTWSSVLDEHFKINEAITDMADKLGIILGTQTYEGASYGKMERTFGEAESRKAAGDMVGYEKLMGEGINEQRKFIEDYRELQTKLTGGFNLRGDYVQPTTDGMQRMNLVNQMSRMEGAAGPGFDINAATGQLGAHQAEFSAFLGTKGDVKEKEAGAVHEDLLREQEMLAASAKGLAEKFVLLSNATDRLQISNPEEAAQYFAPGVITPILNRMQGAMAQSAIASPDTAVYGTAIGYLPASLRTEKSETSAVSWDLSNLVEKDVFKLQLENNLQAKQSIDTLVKVNQNIESIQRDVAGKLDRLGNIMAAAGSPTAKPDGWGVGRKPGQVLVSAGGRSSWQ